MTGPSNKVLIATLWQRTSERGNEYLSGFLGKARVTGLRGDLTPDGEPTWDIYVQPGTEQEAKAGSAPKQMQRPPMGTGAPPRAERGR